jgi:hypothetical protein
VNQLLESAVAAYRPENIHLVRIDQWFDGKWLCFSGKVLGALPVWSKHLTLPPFHPHRVREESHFAATPETGGYAAIALQPLHILQESRQNQTRFVDRISPAAVFLWFSSATRTLDRGSVMLYRTGGEETVAWYAAFHKSPTWRVEKQHGISPQELQHLLRVPASA